MTTTRVPHPFRSRRLVVEAVAPLSPTMRRFAFGGETDDFPLVTFAPAEHVRVVFPDVDGSLRIPQVVDGRPQLDGPRPTMRDYTVRGIDEVGRVLIDMITAHDGPASRWARDAEMGQELGLLGPRGSVVMPSAPHYVLFADETALPALSRWLEEEPNGVPIDAVALVAPASRQELPRRDRTNLIWADDAPQALHALDHLRFTPGTFVWAAGEATWLQTLRRALTELGVPRERRSLDGHWRRGEADFDHHTPLDAGE